MKLMGKPETPSRRICLQVGCATSTAVFRRGRGGGEGRQGKREEKKGPGVEGLLGHLRAEAFGASRRSDSLSRQPSAGNLFISYSVTVAALKKKCAKEKRRIQGFWD